MSTRLVFMGTPDFAVPTLRRIIESGRYQVAAVVTQPDAPAGRGRALAMPPVKRLALEHGLTVLQPERVRHANAVAALQALHPDVIVVAAFGQILPRAILEIPPLGCLNVHASLLPRWRGAAPVAAAILAGDAETGVTIMRMDEGMDTGDILAQARTPILAGDTTGSLTQRLAEMGAELLLVTLPRWQQGEIVPLRQDGSRATTCRPIRKEDARLDWRLPAVVLERMVRAYLPWPGAYTHWNGKLVKILAARVLNHQPVRVRAGQVVAVDKGAGVVTGEGVLVLEQIQLEGRRAMTSEEFIRGQRDFIGTYLG